MVAGTEHTGLDLQHLAVFWLGLRDLALEREGVGQRVDDVQGELVLRAEHSDRSVRTSPMREFTHSVSSSVGVDMTGVWWGVGG